MSNLKYTIQRESAGPDRYGRPMNRPPTESMVFAYMQEHASGAKAPSRAKRLLESLNFLTGVFGFDVHEVTGSRRIIGLAAEQFSRLGTRRQAPPIPAHILRYLEYLLSAEGATEIDKIVAGAAVAMVAFRARFSDVSEVLAVNTRKDRVELEVLKTKTSGLNQDRLPIILTAPIMMLLEGEGWWSSFIAMRNSLKVPFPQYSLFPSRSGGSWQVTEGRL